MVRIGIMDKETEYVTRLCVYLNSYGRGIWNASAFTEKEALLEQMRNKMLDVLVATNEKALIKLNDQFPDKCYVWLIDEKGKKPATYKEQKIYTIYRLQSARLIGDALKDIVEYLGMHTQTNKQSAVIYSPVGRCGKTKMAVDFVSRIAGGKWLYIGMEYYCGRVLLSGGKDDGREADRYGGECDIKGAWSDGVAEDFLYYIKERREDALISIMSEGDGVIPSPFSPFDTRTLNRQDFKWFFEVFEKTVEYRGVIFDMGTGILKDISVLAEFKHIIVPFLSDNISLSKRSQFERLIKAYELDELKSRIKYLDMSKELPMEQLSRLLL